MQKFKNLSTNIKTLKVELNNYKEIYIIYEKPENNKYMVSIYAKLKFNGDLIHQFGFEVPQIAETGIRIDTDEHFEEDIIELALNNAANGNIIWEQELFKN